MLLSDGKCSSIVSFFDPDHRRSLEDPQKWRKGADWWSGLYTVLGGWQTDLADRRPRLRQTLVIDIIVDVFFLRVTDILFLPGANMLGFRRQVVVREHHRYVVSSSRTEKARFQEQFIS